MTDYVKPVSNRNQNTANPAKTQKPAEVKIGGIEFKKDQIEVDKTSSYTLNGKKMNTVFVKPGVQVDFPDQKDRNKKPTIESIGLRNEWYNPDESYININDVDNAIIKGNPNRTDVINLSGKSSNNQIIVNQKGSWYINDNMQKDYVNLDSETGNNTVHMDKKDKTHISYNQIGVEINGVEVQSTRGLLKVEGEGVSAQEDQLQSALSKTKYNDHKLQQKF